MVHFGEFLKTWSLRSNSVTRQVNSNRTKIGGKCQNSKIQMRHFEYFSNNVYNIKILSYFSDRRNPFRMLSNAMDFRNRRKMHRPKSADCDRPLGGGNNSSISENPAGGKIKSYIPKSRFVASFVVLHNWARISWLPNLNENHFAKQAQQTICHALNHMHPKSK